MARPTGSPGMETFAEVHQRLGVMHGYASRVKVGDKCPHCHEKGPLYERDFWAPKPDMGWFR